MKHSARLWGNHKAAAALHFSGHAVTCARASEAICQITAPIQPSLTYGNTCNAKAVPCNELLTSCRFDIKKRLQVRMYIFPTPYVRTSEYFRHEWSRMVYDERRIISY